MSESTIYRTCRNVIGRKKGIVITTPTMTKQAFKEECDINRIMTRYELTHQIEHVNRQQPVYGDFSVFKDYQSLLNTVEVATEAFNALPSELRKELEYKPHKLFEWINDPQNRDRAVKYGLLEPSYVEEHNIQD